MECAVGQALLLVRPRARRLNGYPVRCGGRVQTNVDGVLVRVSRCPAW